MSTEIRHTRAPWRVVQEVDSNGTPQIWIYGPVNRGPLFKAYDLDDGILAATAPELLSALRRLLDALEADCKICPQMTIAVSCETNGQALAAARSAIAKATGGAQ